MSVSLRSAKDPSPRPPRLQPSPSLPNLRVRNPSLPRHLARPQPTPNKPFSQLPSNASFNPDDSHQDSRSSKHSKNQHYLTPPLTPASSLKSDSTDTDSSDPNPPTNDKLVPALNDLPSADVQQSRFLIIGNVPSDLSEDAIGPYFHSLASLDDSTPRSGIPSAQGKSATAKAIQTIDYRFQENRAIILAFYDARVADRVKRRIDAKCSPSHHDRQREASWEEALTCLFVAPDHFLKLLGRSATVFLTRNEGAFYVSVGDMINDRPPSLSSWGRIRFTVPVKLKSVLAKFGELRSFLLMEADEGNHSQLFMIEYYDICAAEAAWESLNGRVVENMKLRLIQKHALRDGGSGPRDFEKEEAGDGGIEGQLGDEHAAEPKTPTTTTYLSQSQATSSSNAVPFPVLNDVVSNDYRCEPERSHNDSSSGSSALNGCSLPISERQKPSLQYPLDKYASITTNPLFTDSSHSRCGTFPSDQIGRRGSNNLFFDAVRSRAPYKRVDPDFSSMNPTGIDVAQVDSLDTGETASGVTDLYSTPYSTAQPSYGRDYFTHADSYAADVSTPAPWVSSPPLAAHNTGPMQYPVPSQSPMSCSSMVWDPLTGNWVPWPPHNLVADQWLTYQSPSVYYPLASHAVPYAFPQQSSPPIPVHPYVPSHRMYPPTYPASPRTPPENNQLDIRKIELGVDTRTTVMVKNIPNKMTDKELIAYINKVCPRRIDFLYLRMDFQNGCNVGYAFVNFISVQDLLTFAKLKLNEKWNLYSSEKVLQMSYANYQGKEALVEKFKNSCIMDEREEWRPKIFYSEPGPKQGLPEEFPKPTHMRRKERSSYNRGALFVPGINSGTAHYSPGKTFLNANPPNQRNSPNRPSFQGDERRQRRTYHGSPVHGDVDVSDEDSPRQR